MHVTYFVTSSLLASRRPNTTRYYKTAPHPQARAFRGQWLGRQCKLEEGGKEGSGPLPWSECLSAGGSWRKGGHMYVRGRGWSEGTTPGEAGENKKTQPPQPQPQRCLFNLGGKGKMIEKILFESFLLCRYYSFLGERGK